MTRHKNSVRLFSVKHDYLKNSFFPSTAVEWNKLDSNRRKSESLMLFKKSILIFIRPFANSVFQCDNPKGLKLIAMLRLGLSHLRFTLISICNYGTVETTVHYLLHYPNFSKERLTLFNKLQSIDENILSKDDSNILKGLLCGDHSFNYVKNTSILTALTEYRISTKCFDAPFYSIWHLPICLCAVYF